MRGTFASGGRGMANSHAENEKCTEKNGLSKNFFFVGLINLVTAILAYKFA
jgi:hypothetical protein